MSERVEKIVLFLEAVLGGSPPGPGGGGAGGGGPAAGVGVAEAVVGLLLLDNELYRQVTI